MVLYAEGSPIYSSVLPIGAQNITNDLAIGLRLSLEEAENLKVMLGNDKNIKDAVLSDFKTFDMNENKIGIGQIETVGMPQVLKYRKRIFEILNSEFKSGKFNLISLLVTDISAQSSVLFAITDDKIKRLLPWPELEKNIFDLKGILSRKKQVVPALSRLFV